MLFLGDAGQPDLLIFAWLRSRLEITFGGLNDALREECGVEVNNRIFNHHSAAESAATPLARECLPDLEDVVGPGCAALLDAGRKIEFEVLISFAPIDPHAVIAALPTTT